MKRIITLFSGGGLFTQGAVLAGLHPVGAVEWDAKISALYANNFGSHILTSAVENVDPDVWQLPPGELDFLQSSPSCKNLSVANSKGGETYTDMTAALGVVRHLVRLQPKCFVLEQVWGYKDTISLNMILGTLKALKYHFVVCKLNAADYGTPQTRIRLFVLAVKRNLGWASIPPATHAKELSNQGSIFDLLGISSTQKWVSWYEACSDLLADLPTTDFAEWQYKRLAILADEGKFDELVKELLADNETGLMVDGQNPGGSWNTNGGIGSREHSQPSYTLVASSYKATFKAFVSDTSNGRSDTQRLTVRNDNQPLFTITADGNHRPKAFLVQSANSQSQGFAPKTEKQPCQTLATSGNWKALLIQRDGTPADEVRMRDERSPSLTLKALDQRNGHQFDALLLQQQSTTFKDYQQLSGIDRVRFLVSLGRVVSLSDRCLMRLQGVPDSYKLGNSHKLNCIVAGNGVAVPVAQAICSHLLKEVP